MLLFSFAIAEEELPEITFRGAKLGATLGEVKETLECSPYKGSAWQYYNVSDILNQDIGLLNNCFTENPAAQRVILADDNLLVEDVAGYQPNYTSAFFIRPVADGKIDCRG